ncbi:MAG: hypothetical protein BWY83_02972 [bacterium ADurb.Bin478]|nr:MAG: hypothetical protein BWY83_02972 [bacterium ADurb.Bin478]
MDAVRVKEQMKQSGADAGDQIKTQEAFLAKAALHIAAEHPQGEQIEEQVQQGAVQKHIGDQLPHRTVMENLIGPQRQPAFDQTMTGGEHLQQIDGAVDEQQSAHHGRQDGSESLMNALQVHDGSSIKKTSPGGRLVSEAACKDLRVN